MIVFAFRVFTKLFTLSTDFSTGNLQKIVSKKVESVKITKNPKLFNVDVNKMTNFLMKFLHKRTDGLRHMEMQERKSAPAFSYKASPKIDFVA